MRSTTTPQSCPPQGRPGVQGPKGDGPFGQITYTDRTVGDEDNFDPYVRQQLNSVAPLLKLDKGCGTARGNCTASGQALAA